MEVTNKTKIGLRIQRWLFIVLFLAAVGLLGWLSNQYVYQADWTFGQRNSLSEESRRLVEGLEGPVIITAYARENETLRARIRELVTKYQRVKPDIELKFVNPDAEPERVRELGITMDGELRVAYQGRSEPVRELSEDKLSNALLRLAQAGERWITFLAGHGERDPKGEANHDLGQFGRQLEQQGLKVQTLKLTETPSIPRNTSVLVIANPQIELLPGEVEMIEDFVAGGGNLLWFMDPDDKVRLDPLAEVLGVARLPGIIVDATTQLFGIQDPAFVLIPDYPNHPITRELGVITLFPRAAALEVDDRDDWEHEAFLTTLSRAWTETGPLTGEIRYDEGTDERAGPLDIGFAFKRTLDAGEDTAGGDESDNDDTEDTGKGADAGPTEQRLVVVGDGDFLANAYLGNGGNLDLGINIIHWLTRNEALISVRPKPAPDLTLELDGRTQAAIGLVFLFILPGGLVIAGIAIWLRRRKR